MTDRQGIEIDYCPQCRGVWLDRGELDKLIERSATPEPQGSSAGATTQPLTYPQERPRYDEHDRDYDNYRQDRPRHDEHDRDYDRKKKKRGNFLEDLFDFD